MIYYTNIQFSVPSRGPEFGLAAYFFCNLQWSPKLLQDVSFISELDLDTDNTRMKKAVFLVGGRGGGINFYIFLKLNGTLNVIYKHLINQYDFFF